MLLTKSVMCTELTPSPRSIADHSWLNRSHLVTLDTNPVTVSTDIRLVPLVSKYALNIAVGKESPYFPEKQSSS